MPKTDRIQVPIMSFTYRTLLVTIGILKKLQLLIGTMLYFYFQK